MWAINAVTVLISQELVVRTAFSFGYDTTTGSGSSVRIVPVPTERRWELGEKLVSRTGTCPYLPPHGTEEYKYSDCHWIDRRCWLELDGIPIVLTPVYDLSWIWEEEQPLPQKSTNLLPNSGPPAIAISSKSLVEILKGVVLKSDRFWNFPEPRAHTRSARCQVPQGRYPVVAERSNGVCNIDEPSRRSCLILMYRVATVANVWRSTKRSDFERAHFMCQQRRIYLSDIFFLASLHPPLPPARYVLGPSPPPCRP